MISSEDREALEKFYGALCSIGDDVDRIATALEKLASVIHDSKYDGKTYARITGSVSTYQE